MPSIFLGQHIKIIYASTSGNVEVVCQKVAEVMQRHGYQTSMHRSEATDISEVVTHPLFILATSTWEHGRLNPFFEPLLKEMQEIDLQGMYAGLIGLGDHRYEPVYFCEGINMIQSTFAQRGGTQVGETLKIDGSPYSKLENVVVDWANLFANHLLEINK